MSCLFTLPVCVFFAVLASFRGTVQNGLPLEIGDTVQILEKCEGKAELQLEAIPNALCCMYTYDAHGSQFATFTCTAVFNISLTKSCHSLTRVLEMNIKFDTGLDCLSFLHVND